MSDHVGHPDKRGCCHPGLAESRFAGTTGTQPFIHYSPFLRLLHNMGCRSVRRDGGSMPMSAGNFDKLMIFKKTLAFM
jgi:hypothetical protein